MIYEYKIAQLQLLQFSDAEAGDPSTDDDNHRCVVGVLCAIDMPNG